MCSSSRPIRSLSALLRETRTIPIVFTWVSDSVGSGYVSSLAHPGGNVTGFHNYEPAVGEKWLGVLKQIAPQTRTFPIVFTWVSDSVGSGYVSSLAPQVAM